MSDTGTNGARSARLQQLRLSRTGGRKLEKPGYWGVEHGSVIVRSSAAPLDPSCKSPTDTLKTTGSSLRILASQSTTSSEASEARGLPVPLCLHFARRRISLLEERQSRVKYQPARPEILSRSVGEAASSAQGAHIEERREERRKMRSRSDLETCSLKRLGRSVDPG